MWGDRKGELHVREVQRLLRIVEEASEETDKQAIYMLKGEHGLTGQAVILDKLWVFLLFWAIPCYVQGLLRALCSSYYKFLKVRKPLDFICGASSVMFWKATPGGTWCTGQWFRPQSVDMVLLDAIPPWVQGTPGMNPEVLEVLEGPVVMGSNLGRLHDTGPEFIMRKCSSHFQSS